MSLSNITNLGTLRHYLIQQQDSKAVTLHWSFMHICTHCSQTILCSITGYPQLKSWIIRKIIGPCILRWFFYRNKMHHNLQAELISASPIDVSNREPLDVLVKAIDQFINYKGELKPHFVFGDLSKDQYDRYFTLHIKDHLNEVSFI